MKKKTVLRKFGMIVMVLALSFAMLTGCGNKDNRNSDEVQSDETMDSTGMVHLGNTEDVFAFMEEVYGGVAEDLLPMSVETNELDLSDMDMISYHTGLTDVTGIEGIYLSESMISSTAYSAVYIRTKEDADAEQIRQQLMENINPAKWVCVVAEKEYGVLFGNDIFFVMGAQDAADEVLNKAIAAAKSRGMSTSEVSEKTNPI